LATASSAYALPQGALASRKTLILRNATSATLWIGSASVSTAVGFPLMENEVLSLDAGANVSIYGFSETANSTAALIEMS
jgi:hypothetical protein